MKKKLDPIPGLHNRRLTVQDPDIKTSLHNSHLTEEETKDKMSQEYYFKEKMDQDKWNIK